MQKKWKHGELVTVVTVNKGLPVSRKGQDAAETWAGKIAGPSLVGPGWWMVRRAVITKGRHSAVSTVPDGEIKPRKR